MLLVLCLEGVHGAGKSELTRLFAADGFEVLDEVRDRQLDARAIAGVQARLACSRARSRVRAMRGSRAAMRGCGTCSEGRRQDARARAQERPRPFASPPPLVGLVRVSAGRVEDAEGVGLGAGGEVCARGRKEARSARASVERVREVRRVFWTCPTTPSTRSRC